MMYNMLHPRYSNTTVFRGYVIHGFVYGGIQGGRCLRQAHSKDKSDGDVEASETSFPQTKGKGNCVCLRFTK